ncbi:MAG: rhomboid family intramembrane serine protease [Flavobacteriales bacterium]|nr:rhomboid family intramembrane serine protease [Flavobacteriales bacterium]
MHRIESLPVDHDRRRLLTALLPPAMAVALMWIVLGFDLVYHLGLSRFGILPRTLEGLRGILFAPFLHGGVDHLLSNSMPLLVLGWFTVYFYPKASGKVVLVSWLATGLWVWVFGRDSHHIGASGVVYALAGFVFFSGLFRRRIALMAVSLIVVFLYGSMWWGILPIQPGVSWESHLFGGIVGSIMAWFYRKVPPAHVPPPRVYDDEEEEDGEVELAAFNDPGDEQPLTPDLGPQERPDPMYDPSRTSSTYPWE